MRLIKKPISQFIGKTWIEIEKEITIYLQKWADTYPRGFEEITDLIRNRAEISVFSDGHIIDDSGVINYLSVYIEGSSEGPLTLCFQKHNLKDIARIIKDEEEKAKTSEKTGL